MMEESARKRALRLLFFTVFLDLLGFGLIIPQFPYYATHFHAGGFAVGVIAASYSFFQFLFAPMWGQLSDRIGRRPIILMGLLGSGMSYVIFGGVSFLSDATGIGAIPLMFISRSLAGLFTANISTAQAYVADITPEEGRAAGMGVIGAAFGLGFIFGPAFSAFIGKWFGMSMPFYAAGALSLVNASLAYAYLPESLEPGRAPRRFDRLGTILKLRPGPLLWVMLIWFLSTTAMGAMENTLGLLIAQEPRFNLDAVAFAELMVFIGIVIVVTQGYILRKIKKRCDETTLILIGAVAMIFGLGLPGWVPRVSDLYVLMALTGFGNGLLNPSVASLASILAAPEARGEVMGLGQAMSALGRIVGPVVGGWLYQHSGHPAPYAMAGVTMIVSLGLGLILRASSPGVAIAPQSS